MKTKFSASDPPAAVILAIEDALDCGKVVELEKDGTRHRLKRYGKLTLIERVR